MRPPVPARCSNQLPEEITMSHVPHGAPPESPPYMDIDSRGFPAIKWACWPSIGKSIAPMARLRALSCDLCTRRSSGSLACNARLHIPGPTRPRGASQKGTPVGQKVVIEITDDLDGSEDAETVTFSLDGQSYEIDLSEKNAGELRKALAPYADAARKQGGARRRPRRIASGADTPNPVEVRAWAATQGIEVAARGRIPAEVVERYLTAK